jgi:hypothetical protein
MARCQFYCDAIRFLYIETCRRRKLISRARIMLSHAKATVVSPAFLHRLSKRGEGLKPPFLYNLSSTLERRGNHVGSTHDPSVLLVSSVLTSWGIWLASNRPRGRVEWATPCRQWWRRWPPLTYEATPVMTTPGVSNRTLTLIERGDDTSSWEIFLIYFSHSTIMLCPSKSWRYILIHW